MQNAVYYNPTKVLFGKGVEENIAEEIRPFAERVLLVYGGKSAEKSGLLDRMRKSLEQAGIHVVELGGVQPNPLLSKVREGIALARDNAVGLVLGVGGGSVIDTAKAVAIGTPNPEDVWDYYAKGAEPMVVLPVAAVLTIPGAGSESSTGSVITNDETQEKLSYDSDKLRPVVAALNPELTYTLPAYQTAAGITDAIAHVLERYFTNTKNVDVTDRMSESVIKTLMKYARRAIRYPEDYEARAEVMWACKVAHDGTLGVGREEDWASHDIEHELSARYDVTHGAGLAVVMPAWMKYVYRHDPARFAQFAQRIFGVEYDYEYPENTAREGISRFMGFLAGIGMPTSLRELGVMDEEDMDEMALRAAEHGGGSVGHFVPLKAEDIRTILQIAE